MRERVREAEAEGNRDRARAHKTNETLVAAEKSTRKFQEKY